MRTHNTACSQGSVVILSGDFGPGNAKSLVLMTDSWQQAQFLAQLYCLGPSLRA